MTIGVYGALVRLLHPTGFNDAFADELRAVFVDLDGEARAGRSRLGGSIAASRSCSLYRPAWRAICRRVEQRVSTR